jgi:hypothetical protein
MIKKPLSAVTRRTAGLFAVSLLAMASFQVVHAQSTRGAAAAPAAMSTNVAEQINLLLQDKEARSPAQQKVSSHLLYAAQAARGQAMAGLSEMYDNATVAAAPDANGLVKVDISGTVTRELLRQITAVGGTLGYTSAAQGAIRATLPLLAIETVAANAAVKSIEPAALLTTNVGALTSQGYVSHNARAVVNSGYNGTGVRVGVMSDSAQSLPTLIGSGDLLPSAFIATGLGGPTTGSSEGSAMMEIVQDLAPGATVIFATAYDTPAQFADNIRTLRNVYNCDIIVDDISYFAEPAFQDGPIAQAVNDVTASGALYFSAAANSGNLTSGTSGTWEGDFNPGAASASPLPTGYTLHIFSGTQTYNPLTLASTYIDLKWADPVGGSTNDYDMWVLNAAGTSILCSATTTQSGTQDPIESCYGTSRAAGTRIVVGKKAAASARALRIDTHRGALTFSTSGSTYGHNAAANTVSMAAVYWNSAKTGTKPFVGGAANPTESFSSDGPRKIFFNPNGTPITPGNFLFGTNGGTTLVKPDLAGADGTSAKTPGFLQFFGTSAAAPHAAAVAALIKSARPDYTNAQILAAMKATALDIRGAGIDRDAGYGLILADQAVLYALTH